MDSFIKKNLERIVKLYFKGYSVKEAIEIIREKSIKKMPFAEGTIIKNWQFHYNRRK